MLKGKTIKFYFLEGRGSKNLWTYVKTTTVNNTNFGRDSDRLRKYLVSP